MEGSTLKFAFANLVALEGFAERASRKSGDEDSKALKPFGGWELNAGPLHWNSCLIPTFPPCASNTEFNRTSNI